MDSKQQSAETPDPRYMSESRDDKLTKRPGSDTRSQDDETDETRQDGEAPPPFATQISARGARKKVLADRMSEQYRLTASGRGTTPLLPVQSSDQAPALSTFQRWHEYDDLVTSSHARRTSSRETSKRPQVLQNQGDGYESRGLEVAQDSAFEADESDDAAASIIEADSDQAEEGTQQPYPDTRLYEDSSHRVRREAESSDEGHRHRRRLAETPSRRTSKPTGRTRRIPSKPSGPRKARVKVPGVIRYPLESRRTSNLSERLSTGSQAVRRGAYTDLQQSESPLSTSSIDSPPSSSQGNEDLTSSSDAQYQGILPRPCYRPDVPVPRNQISA